MENKSNNHHTIMLLNLFSTQLGPGYASGAGNEDTTPQHTHVVKPIWFSY
jgi:hypothetical protein